MDEAKNIGLRTVELDGDLLDTVWSIHRLAREKRQLELVEKQKRLPDRFKDLPQELLDLLPFPEDMDSTTGEGD